MADRRWLEQRGRGYYAVMDVPRPMREALGKKRLVKSLRTRDINLALTRRFAALAEFRRTLDSIESVSAAPLVEAGLTWRATLAAIDAGDPDTITAHGGHQDDGWWRGEPEQEPPPPRERARANAEWFLYEHVEQVGETHGDEAATTLRDVALGRATPLLYHVDAWLAEGGAKGPLRERTRAQYRSDVARLAAWAQRVGVPGSVEAFTRKVAGRYVSEELVARGVESKTANRQISAASAYWRWLMKRAGIEGNPWQGQMLAKVAPADPSARRKRPFTDAEVARLLAGCQDPELADLMRVAALSGMRVEETYRLTVARCAGGWFDITNAKSRAGWRRVPIHSALAEIVARRTAGQPAGAFLFPEAGSARPGRERSMAISKRFGRYRQTVGVHEREEGRRQSSVDLHSFRRWFITAARNADFDQPTVAAVVGHEAGNITDAVYSGGPSEEVKRRLVEAVRLPGVASEAQMGSRDQNSI